jgi:hypothetical protein
MAIKKSAKSKPAKSHINRRPRRPGNSAGSGEKVQASISRRLPSFRMSAKLRRILIVFGIAVTLIVGLELWYIKIYSNPERVFWNMIDNNLSTEGFTRETKQPVCVPNADSTNIIQTSFTPTFNVRCITHIEQGNIKLKIETIGDVTADYERYVKVETEGDKTSEDKYSKIYDMWLKNNGNEKATANLYSQLLNSPVLFANLKYQQKKELSESLRKVYIVDYKNVVKERSGLKQEYVFSAQIPLKNFTAAEKIYAKKLNLPIADQINPESYSDESRVSVKLRVDVISRHLMDIEFQNIKEKYSGYGISKNINIPNKTVSITELQNAFQSISN